MTYLLVGVPSSWERLFDVFHVRETVPHGTEHHPDKKKKQGTPVSAYGWGKTSSEADKNL